MLCPNCNESMHFVSLDNQIIRHCSHCGASFFEENGLEKISLESAQKLSANRQTSIILGQQKLCPIDQTPFVQKSNQITMPENTTIFHCPKCQGVFLFPEDLINLKQKQIIKLNYDKRVSVSPVLKTAMVFSFVGLLVAGVVSFGNMNNKKVTSTQAKDLIGQINISTSNRYLFVSFTTSLPMKSEIKFSNNTGENITLTINSATKTTHLITTDQINLKENHLYQITLTDEKGRKIVTEKKILEF